MKLSRLLYLASILLLAVSCGKDRKNELKERGYYPGGGYNPADIFRSIRCQSGYGPGRITAHLRAQGSFHDGYFAIRSDSPLTVLHGASGHGGRVYVGASTVGDIIEVRPISGSEAHVSLHLCEQRSLIMPGRHVIQAHISRGRGIILKSRPNCEVDEVTAANFMVYLGPYQQYSGTQFPLAFTRVQDIVHGFCAGAAPYWPY